MSTRHPIHADRVLALLSAGLMLGGALGALLYFGLGLDLLASPGLGVPCPFQAITGLGCPGCGMTRALLLVSQLQWIPALRMNPLVFLLLGFAVLSLAEYIAKRSPSTRPGEASRHACLPERFAIPAVGLVLLYWVHTVVV